MNCYSSWSLLRCSVSGRGGRLTAESRRRSESNLMRNESVRSESGRRVESRDGKLKIVESRYRREVSAPGRVGTGRVPFGGTTPGGVPGVGIGRPRLSVRGYKAPTPDVSG